MRLKIIMQEGGDALKYLNDRYNILVVSSTMEFPDSLKEKLEWVKEFYPFIRRRLETNDFLRRKTFNQRRYYD
jgi:5'(3')-deoxyribonucleotidase